MLWRHLQTPSKNTQFVIISTKIIMLCLPTSEVVPDLSKLAEIYPKIHTLSCIPEKCIRYIEPFWEVFGCFWVVQDPPKMVKTPQNITYTSAWTETVLTQKHPKNTSISPTSSKTFCDTPPVILHV